MDFVEKELRIILQSLYRYRGDVSGASQEERNRFEAVEKVIKKIEEKTGPIVAEKTAFDREMESSLRHAEKPAGGKKK